jgi:hypothetical protein
MRKSALANFKVADANHKKAACPGELDLSFWQQIAISDEKLNVLCQQAQSDLQDDLTKVVRERQRIRRFRSQDTQLTRFERSV